MRLPMHMAKKTSGQVWLDDVPEHWTVRRLKFQVNKVGSGVTPSGGAESYERQGIPLLRSQNVHFDGLRMDDVVFISPETHESMANSKVRPNDVLLNITGASIGRCCVVPPDIGEANVNQHVAVVRSDSSIEPRFLAYLLSADPGQEQIVLSQTGSGREGLTFEAIRNFAVPLPLIPEQQQIAAFLDWKTGQIDALIARKQELLEKLKEKRVAVITQAVTRGLNPAAPLRDSGSPWLGQVPEHWDVKRLRFAVSTLEQGWSPQCDNQPADDDSWGVMKVGCVNGDIFDPFENKALPPDLAAKEHYELEPRDIIISRANTKELLGSAAIVPADVRPKLLLCDKLFRARTPEEVDEEFLTYYLRTPAARYQYEREATGASDSMQNIGQDTIKNLVVTLPPLEEQKLICLVIRKVVLRLDKLTTAVNSALARLTEYRTALITAATTGKMDVCNVKIPESAA